MTISKHRVFLILTALELAVVVGLVAAARRSAGEAARLHVPAMQAIAARLELTDLAVWTEARYTRHPSQADLFSPFQDFPSSLEHFPAGSVVGVPDLGGLGQPAELQEPTCSDD